MNIDLEGELSRLAQSVHDDGATDRMSGQVRHMVGRIKRRRAARHTAQGAVGIGAAAAVAFGGVQLAGRPDVQPPATTPTNTTPTAVEGFGACGSTVIDPNPRLDAVFRLDATVRDVDVSGADPKALVDLSFTGDTTALSSVGDARMVVAQQGVVVGPLATLTPTQTFPPSYSFEQPLVSCEDGAALPEGSYEIYALQEATVGSDEDAVQVLGGPWAVTVDAPDPGPTSTPDAPDSETDAQAMLDDIVANPVQDPEYGVFPICGVVAAEVLDDGMPVLELDLDEAELSLPAGELYEGTVRLHTTLKRYAIGNASPNATLVVLKDDVVVGYQWLDSEDLTLVDLADGQELEFPVRGTMNLCGTGEGGEGPLVPLPAGEYRFMASLDVMVKETGGPGEEPSSATFLMPATSEAGYLTVTEP